ncbi:MAG: hypothetical protein O2894_03070 [Planctomycetota bacterium]|nr:hypothetical protein [Planctomycetota bacterium]
MESPLAADCFVEDAENPGIPICPHCFEEIELPTHFCAHCMAPLTFYANTGPYESIWAAAWILARAFQTAWPRPIHVVGQLIHTGPAALGSLGAAVLGASVLGSSGEVGGAIGTAAEWFLLIVPLIMGVASATFVCRTCSNWFARRGIDPWPPGDDEEEEIDPEALLIGP